MVSFWMLAVVACQLQPAAAAVQAEIQQTQLPAYTAAVEKIEPAGVQFRLGSESRSLPFDQLLHVRFSDVKKTAATEKIALELADGSLVNSSQITSDGKNVVLTWADQSSIAVPARQVTSCLLQPLDAVRAKQWQAIIDSRNSGDVLVVQRSAEALDKIEGVISGVTETVVKFQFDGQSVDVPRAKLAGWKYFSPEANSRPKLLAVVRDDHGSNWMVQSVAGQWSDRSATAELKLVCGVDLRIPIASIADIDFSFGSMRFLADMEPLERKVAPRLTLAVALPEAEQLFGPRAVAAESQRGATAGPGVEFMGSGTIVYRVPTDFRKLLGTVALTPDGPQFVPCKAQVLIEEKVVWEKTLSSPQEVFPVEINVDPGKRIRLVVQAESAQPVGDRVTWRQLRFVK